MMDQFSNVIKPELSGYTTQYLASLIDVQHSDSAALPVRMDLQIRAADFIANISSTKVGQMTISSPLSTAAAINVNVVSY